MSSHHKKVGKDSVSRFTNNSFQGSPVLMYDGHMVDKTNNWLKINKI